MGEPTLSVPSNRKWKSSWLQIQQNAETLKFRGAEMIELAKMEANPLNANTEARERVSTSGVSKPTENEAMARVLGEVPQDIVAQWLAELFTVMDEIRVMSKEAERLVWLVDHRADERVGRVVVGGDCEGCDRYCTGAANDRRKSGLCTACYPAWLRYRRDMHKKRESASRYMFRIHRQKQLPEGA